MLTSCVTCMHKQNVVISQTEQQKNNTKLSEKKTLKNNFLYQPSSQKSNPFKTRNTVLRIQQHTFGMYFKMAKQPQKAKS